MPAMTCCDAFERSRGKYHAGECGAGNRGAKLWHSLPEGFVLRRPRPLSPSSLKSRPLSGWRGDLNRLLEAGAGERWITPTEAGLGCAGGVVGSLLDRGALLVAEKRTVKRYRLTPHGIAVARGWRS